jgi:aldehyde dehydrogenase (NAD+)
VAILEYYAQASFAALGATLPPAGPGLLFTERRPHGLAGLVTPWNFPLAIPLWKAAPALAAGNGVLLKPSPDATATALWLGELLAGALPEGLVQVLPGGAETGQAVLAAADVVSFTGSVAAGRQVAGEAVARGVPVQAEMGGQNAAIVLPDAGAGPTATLLAAAAMGFAGQKCTATRRIVVIGSAARVGDVTDALVAAVRALTLGDPAEAGVQIGPVISEQARCKVLAASQGAVAAGGRLLHGGPALGADGWYVTPALLGGVGPAHPVVQEETFGPLAVVQPAADLGEALQLAEGVRYGLVTSIHGRDLGQLLTAVRGVGTGLVTVNAPTTGVDFWAPFGGERDSSYGQREQGMAALDFYASTRTVTLAPHP